jgi:hypothetical protein
MDPAPGALGPVSACGGATRNSTSARWASKSSTGRNCRRCSVHGKTRDCRNSTARHYTSSVAHTLECRGLISSNHKLERCCRAVDDSRAGSRSRASDSCAAGERARRTRWLAAATRALHLIGRMCATLVQRIPPAIQMRQVVENFVSQPGALTRKRAPRAGGSSLIAGPGSTPVSALKCPRRAAVGLISAIGARGALYLYSRSLMTQLGN